MEKISETEIARKGFLTVNLPILLIIFGSWFALIYSDYFGLQSCAIISCAIGWIYWEFALDKWILWSLNQGIEKEKLYRIGKRNLLVWSEFKINKIAEKLNKK
ncbi:MAG: hypothetical protein KA210_02270 [Bacteroidia bacterium]|nr:hypothetical protein [Bacteroidia bacterium]